METRRSPLLRVYRSRKRSLLDDYPGILSGLAAASDLQSPDWTPVYILSTIVLQAFPAAPAYSCKSHICTNVVWAHHSELRLLYITLFTDPTFLPASSPRPKESRLVPYEALIIVTGLTSTAISKSLFSGVWDICPPSRQWTVHITGIHPPAVFIFYHPLCDASRRHCLPGRVSYPRPAFFCRGYLVSDGLPLNRLGVNYMGDLDIVAPGGHTLLTGGGPFDMFLRLLAVALDTAICTMPELGLSRLSRLGEDAMRAADAYREAFRAAWLRLDDKLAPEAAATLYPYAVCGNRTGNEESSSEREERTLLVHLGKHPVPICAHVRNLLEDAGAFPSARNLAESMLLSAPGTRRIPHGAERVCAALAMLFFPGREREEVLCLRAYSRKRPRVAWDPLGRMFVMSDSVACEHEGHRSTGAAEPCLCWVGVVLLEAVASWRSKNEDVRVISDAAVFHSLLICTNARPPTDMAPMASIPPAPVWEDEGPGFEYADLPVPNVTMKPMQGPATPVRPSAPSQLSIRRKARKRSSVFVITPLSPNSGPGSHALAIPSRVVAPSSASASSGSAGAVKRASGRASRPAIEDEEKDGRAALEAQLAEAQATVSSLRAALGYDTGTSVPDSESRRNAGHTAEVGAGREESLRTDSGVRTMVAEATERVIANVSPERARDRREGKMYPYGRDGDPDGLERGTWPAGRRGDGDDTDFARLGKRRRLG
ncbi:hypothetical protein C8Q77DRAFT_1120316 [Trametes polyzona]|nr:hypothetical protein C8Q77DRAFT_1120316 [Trametes polyzona]